MYNKIHDILGKAAALVFLLCVILAGSVLVVLLGNALMDLLKICGT